MTGLGALPPPRPDQRRVPQPPTLQPGSTQTVRARYIIVTAGAADGVFVYGGGGPGGLLASIAAGTADPSGNPVKPVITIYGANGSAIQLSAPANFPTLDFITEAAAAQIPPNVSAFSAATGRAAEQQILSLQSGEESSSSGIVDLQLQSASADGTLPALARLLIALAPVLDVTAAHILAYPVVSAQQPAAAEGTPEVWHPMTLENGWSVSSTGFAQYKLYADGTVGVRFAGLTPGTTANGTVIWAFPASAYNPALADPMSFPVAASAAEMVIRAGTGMQCYNVPAGTTSLGATFRYPLD